MIIIGEKLNSSIPSVKRLFDADDREALSDLILRQRDAGADFIDLNTALCSDETGQIKLLCDIVLDKTDCGIVIDSPDMAVSKEVLAYIRGKDGNRKCVLNSITVNERHENIETALKYKAGLVVLLTDESGIPGTEKRFENAEKMINTLRSCGFNDGDIYIDAIVESVATGADSAAVTLDTIKLIRAAFPDVHILVGLSNISFGLPKRSCLNAAFLTLAVYNGLDCAICDPLSPDIKTAYLAAKALNGTDDFCMEYIDEFR